MHSLVCRSPHIMQAQVLQKKITCYIKRSLLFYPYIVAHTNKILNWCGRRRVYSSDITRKMADKRKYQKHIYLKKCTIFKVLLSLGSF